MSCDFAHEDGAYVLGALSSSERVAFEQHLARCSDCARAVRQLAGLPGLLARVDASVLEVSPGAGPVPETLLPRLLADVRRTHRRRTVLIGGVAAVALVLAGVVPVLVSNALPEEGPQASPPTVTATPPSGRPTATPPSGRPTATPPSGRPTATPPSGRPTATPPAGRTMVPLGGAPVRASIVLDSVAWGTRLDLTCTYAPLPDQYELPTAAVYVLVVRTRDGGTEQVGTWRAIDGRTMRLSAATSVPRADIASVEVRTTSGRRVLELTA